MSMQSEVSVVLSLLPLELSSVLESDDASLPVDPVDPVDPVVSVVEVSSVVTPDVDPVSLLLAPVSSVVNGTVVFAPSFDVTVPVVDDVE